jgi:hypothetical protein
MPPSSDLVVEHPAAYLRCGHCQRVVTEATAEIRRFPGIDVVSCRECQLEQVTAELLVVAFKAGGDGSVVIPAA